MSDITTPEAMREAAAQLVETLEAACVDPYVKLWAKNRAEAIRALPVAEPFCTWPSCGHTAKGQCRTYTSGQLIAPNDASITATNMPVAEPEPVAVNAVMCAAERDAQSRVAVDLTLFRQAIRAEALEEAAKLATSFLVGDPKNGVPLRNPLAHEIADAIRALMLARAEKAAAQADYESRIIAALEKIE